MEKKSIILITGSGGMVGSALLRQLKQAGYENILHPLRSELDLCSQNDVLNFFQKYTPEYVFHLAARVGGIYANSQYPAQFIYDNTQMQCNILEACVKFGVKKLLFPGSGCTYPKHAEQPIKESAFLTGLIEPTNLAYAIAKINGLVAAQSYAKQYGITVVLPMPINAYGVGDNFDPQYSHVIPALMKRLYIAKQDDQSEVVIWGSGNPLREFIYVDDLADAFLFLMDNYHDSDLINVGTMSEISIASLAKKIADVVGYSGRLVFDSSKPDGAPRKSLDSTHLIRLGWNPKVTLREGLERMFQEFKCDELAKICLE